MTRLNGGVVRLCGREACEDDHSSGRPKSAATPENVNKVHDLVMKDCRMTIKHLAEILKISFGTVQAILTTDLELNKV